jgi:hypothetical protein
MIGLKSVIVYLSAALPTFVIGLIIGLNWKKKDISSISNNKQFLNPSECEDCPIKFASWKCSTCCVWLYKFRHTYNI